VPVAVRRRYGLEAGDEVEFIAEPRGAYLIPLKRSSLLELGASLRSPKGRMPLREARIIGGKKRGTELERKARQAERGARRTSR
jgi:bifunctional DNA-binding transcriptional regulator/antitoxin component of YhaV-PrlF toxin-antitoxin module